MRRLLLPLTPLYRLGLAVRDCRLRSGSEPVRRLQYPVVSIGNLSTGGSGKTPLTIALANALTQRGLSVDILSRGYGRESQLAVQVNPQGSASEFGDEPLLIAQKTGLPVYVAPQRYNAGVLAEKESTGTRIHLLDDGFQHRQLHRDVNILLLSQLDCRDHLLPAGNLREPLSAIKRASVLAIPREDTGLEAHLREQGWQGPVWYLRRSMAVPDISGPVVAFCGIARPGQFFKGLESAGLQLVERIVFSDHHIYTRRDLDRLKAATKNATLITTEKDRVRLGQSAEQLSLATADLTACIENESAAIDWLMSQIACDPSHPTL